MVKIDIQHFMLRFLHNEVYFDALTVERFSITLTRYGIILNLKHYGMSFTFRIVIVFCLLLSRFPAQAQIDTIGNLEKFTVETKYKPRLTDARKVEAYPEQEPPESTPPVLKYENLPHFKFKVASVYRQSQAISLKADKPETLYGNYFRLGFGNYTTPLAEVYLNSVQSEKYSYGAHVKHLSSQGKPATADFSDNTIGVFGKKEMSKGILKGRLDYTRNVFHFYGFNDTLNFEKGQVNQIFNDVTGNVHFDNVPEKHKIGTAFDFDFYNFSNLQANEFDVMGSNLLKFNLREGTLRIMSSADFTQLKNDSLTYNRTFIHIFPSYEFEIKKFKIIAGMRYTYFDDSAKGKSYPSGFLNVEHYIVKDKLKFIAGLDGGLTKNSLRSLSRTNQFINGRPLIENSFESYRLHASLQGGLKKIMDFNVGVSHSGMSDLPLYVADTGAIPAFSVIYDNGSVFRFFGQMNFNINENFKLWVNGTLFNYNMKREAYAWQLPSFDASLGMSYHLAEKFNIRLQTYAAGDRFQKILTPVEKSKKLAPYVDVNLLADYRYKKNVSFFLQVGNITNGRYQQWYQYPVFGLNVLLGVTFSL